MDDGTGRDVAQRQAVAGLDVGALAGLDAVALLQVVRGQDVALLAVGVVQQRDAAVRLGSYSMCATLAGTPSLSWRRKSITR